jgi:DNA polymerase III delta subunit
MLLAIVGLDEFAKDERIAKFWEESLKGGSQRKIFFASDYSRESKPLTADVATALAPSFFEPAASVLVRHCEFMLADEQKRLADFISKGIQGNLMLDFAELDKRSSLWKLLEKANAAEIYDPPSKYGNAVQNWVANHAQKHFKRSISHEAAQYIADAIGADTKRIHSEIKKILLYDENIKEINMQHCALFIEQNRDVPAYELQESFGFRNVQAFLPRFRRILAEGGDDAFMPIVGALRSHALNLLHIQSMRAKKIPDYDIAAKVLPPKQGFLYQKNRLPEQSSRWTQNALQNAILRLDELSYGKKVGFYTDLPSFELAIFTIFYPNNG